MDDKINIKDVLNYSAIFGLVLVAFALLTELLALEENYVMSALQLALVVGGVYWVILRIRDQLLDGFISYSKVIRLALMISFLGGIILGFYTYLSLEYFNQEQIDLLFETTYTQLEEQGLNDTQIESAMTMYEEIYTPRTLAIMSVFMIMFTGFMSSLLFGILLKNEPVTLQNNDTSSEDE